MDLATGDDNSIFTSPDTCIPVSGVPWSKTQQLISFKDSHRSSDCLISLAILGLKPVIKREKILLILFRHSYSSSVYVSVNSAASSGVTPVHRPETASIGNKAPVR